MDAKTFLRILRFGGVSKSAANAIAEQIDAAGVSVPLLAHADHGAYGISVPLSSQIDFVPTLLNDTTLRPATGNPLDLPSDGNRLIPAGVYYLYLYGRTTAFGVAPSGGGLNIVPIYTPDDDGQIVAIATTGGGDAPHAPSTPQLQVAADGVATRVQGEVTWIVAVTGPGSLYIAINADGEVADGNLSDVEVTLTRIA